MGKKQRDVEELKMDTGEKDEDVYSDEGRDKLVEEYEISPEEEEFMEGEESSYKEE